MPLTAARIRAAALQARAYKLFDGGGLAVRRLEQASGPSTGPTAVLAAWAIGMLLVEHDQA